MEDRIHLTLMDIVLDNDKKEYQAGDKVTGVFKIAFKGRLNIKDLQLCLVCMAEVKWVENSGTHYHRAGHVYYDKKKFLENTYVINEQCKSKLAMTIFQLTCLLISW